MTRYPGKAGNRSSVFLPGSEANDWQGTGGELKPQYVPVYADYLVRYLDAYRADLAGLVGREEFVAELRSFVGPADAVHGTLIE